MIGLEEAYAIYSLTALAALVPLLLGIAWVKMVKKPSGSEQPLLLGVALGIVLFSFFDLMEEAAGLGISVPDLPTQTLFMAAFTAGLLGLGFSAGLLGKGGRLDPVKSRLSIVYLWALGLGFHGLGEGVVVGVDFLGGGLSLRVTDMLSFTLHKGLEGFTIAALLYGVREGVEWRDVGALGLLAGLPVTLGAALGVSGAPGITSALFFAVGAGAVVFILPRLVELRGGLDGRGAGFLLAILLGVVVWYISGVLHLY